MDKQQQRQEHFNKAYLGVIAQGEPAIGGSTSQCQYLSASGSKCSVGHLLTEEELEECGSYLGCFSALIVDKTFRDGHPFYADKIFYSKLQLVHDELWSLSGPTFVDFFKRGMKLFAEKYKLEVPEHD